jgi:peptidoglycan hydrolase-like protein with peptidoglycan-binding domain
VVRRPLLATALSALAACTVLAGCGHAPITPESSTPPTATATSVPSAGGGSSPAPSDRPSATATPAPPSASPTEEPASDPTTKPRQPDRTTAALLSRGDRGLQVRELQHRLRQLDWFSGRITGRYEQSTVRAVKGFQDKRGFRDTGAVDRRTWKRLIDMTRKPTKAEMHNRLVPGPAILRVGSQGDRVRDLQARLKQIAWFFGNVTGTYGSITAKAVSGFQAKRGFPVTGAVDQRTLDRLRGMTRTPTNDELHNRGGQPSAVGLDPRCRTGRAICVSKGSNSLAWVIDGTVQMRMDVRFGAYETPTRNGSFRVGWKSRHHVSSIYRTPMPYAMFFSGGQAVHYSPDFAARGYAGASHGCVNVRNLGGIQSLFSQVRVGDKVIVYA